MAKTIEIDGVQVSFERRREGGTTYTWAYAKLGDEYVMLGDPWPAINWPKRELEKAVQAELARRGVYHIRSALLIQLNEWKPDSPGHLRAIELRSAGEKVCLVLDRAGNTAIVLASSYDWKRSMTLAECKWADIDERDILPGSWPDICYEVHKKMAA